MEEEPKHGGKRKNAGRKPDAKVPRTRVFQTRLTDAEAEAVNALKQDGESGSAFVRRLLLEAAGVGDE